MGWWWSSNTTASTSTEGAPRPEAVPSAPSPVLPRQQNAPPKPVSADSELEALVASLDSPSPTSKYTSNATPAPKETPTHYAPSPSGSTTPSGLTPTVEPDHDISPDALYPRTMSCRQAFDQAFYCQSLGGKFNDVYRYGELKSCSDNWNAFWFCMRVKALPDLEKEERVREFYKAKDLKNKAEKGSSEDVWDIRTEPVKRAFWKDPDQIES